MVDLAVLGQWSDSVVLEVFSNLNNSMLTAEGFIYTHSIGCAVSGKGVESKGCQISNFAECCHELGRVA